MAPPRITALRAVARSSPSTLGLRATTTTTAAAARAFSSSRNQILRLAAARPRALQKLPSAPQIQTVSRQARRAYSDDAPRRRPGVIRLTFRWLWRLTYLSVLGYLGYVGYIVYIDRHPPPQSPPDPNKKTLVILGTSRSNRGIGPSTGRVHSPSLATGPRPLLTRVPYMQVPAGDPSPSSRSSTRITTTS
jgi:NADH:ubiquinone reductase (non-electrogenic)